MGSSKPVLLLARALTPDVMALLEPAEPGLPSQAQAALLSRAGFTPLWQASMLHTLQCLGAVIARTRTDGACWPYARAAHEPSKFAVWGFESDIKFLADMAASLTPGALSANGLGAVVALIEARLQKGGLLGLTEDQREAVQTIIALGKPESVFLYLESLG